jgi:hypothetical protein
MNAMVVGGAVAAVMAGPPLYAMVQSGQLDSTSAIGRGLLVAGVCAAGASYVLNLMNQYEKESARKTRQEALLKALGEAEEAAKRQADAAATAAAAQNQQNPRKPA